MPDIAIVWNPATGSGDWARPDQEATAGGDLAAAVLVSLFTDRRATADTVPPDGTGDRRGVWTDTYDTEPLGSCLWLLDRARRTQQTLLAARDYCNQALAWMIKDGIATAIDTRTFWAGKVAMGISITIHLANAPAATITTQFPFAAPGSH